MWPFGKKAKLCRSVEKLAIYNDKGAAWAGHSDTEIAKHRAASVEKIRLLVEDIGRQSLPQDFLSAIDNGDLATDLTGQYYEMLKS